MQTETAKQLSSLAEIIVAAIVLCGMPRNGFQVALTRVMGVEDGKRNVTLSRMIRFAKEYGCDFITPDRDSLIPKVPGKKLEVFKDPWIRKEVSKILIQHLRHDDWTKRSGKKADPPEVIDRDVEAVLEATTLRDLADALDAAGVPLSEFGKVQSTRALTERSIMRAIEQLRVDTGAFHPTEHDALEQIVQKWRAHPHPVLIESNDPHRGWRALLHLADNRVAYTPLSSRTSKPTVMLFDSGNRSVLHLHLGRLRALKGKDFRAAFLLALEKLLDLETRLDPKRGQPGVMLENLIRKLDERNALLIVHDASLLYNNEDTKPIVSSWASIGGPANRPEKARGLRIVLMRWIETDLRHTATLECDSIAPEERFDYFKREVGRYCGKFGQGSRIPDVYLWRVSSYYSWLKDCTVHPITIRFRAACLAAPNRLHGHDTTQGANALLADDLFAQAPDIRMMVEDIETHLCSMKVAELKLVRAISTCSYYGTEAFLTRVLKTEGDPAALVPEYILRIAGTTTFVMSHAVRAVVQDHWIKHDPVDRAKVHGKIASWMRDIANSKSKPQDSHVVPGEGVGRDSSARGPFKLDPYASAEDFVANEYPFDPPWNHADVISRSEAIRHFVRAAQSIEKLTGENANDLYKAAYEELEALGEIDVVGPGKDPYQTRRSLSLQSGQYLLKLELFQLLSDPECTQLGSKLAPPAVSSALNTNYRLCPNAALGLEGMERAEWYREMGYALGLSLNYNEAIISFDAGYAALKGTESIEAAWARLRMLLAKLRFRVEALAPGKFLSKGMFSELRKEQSEIHRLGGKEERKKANREVRIMVSWALAMRTDNPPLGAIRTARRLAEADRLTALPNPELFCVIDTLAQSRDPEDAVQALQLCERCILYASEHQFDHEVLRLSVRKSYVLLRIVRDPAEDEKIRDALLNVAETVLDSVAVRIERHGASLHTLTEFRLASLAILIKQKRPLYALAAYGVPGENDLAGIPDCRLANLMSRRVKEAKAAARNNPDEEIQEERMDAARAASLGVKGNDPLNATLALDRIEDIKRRMSVLRYQL